MAGIEDMTLDEVFEELREEFLPYEPIDGDFAIIDVMDKFGLSRGAARNRVDRLLEKKRIRKVGTYQNRAYYRLTNALRNPGD